MLQPSWDSTSKGTLSSSPTIKEQRPSRPLCGACTTILPLPKSDCRSACLGFAGETHIDILLMNAQAIMGFRIERDTVKFANYKEAATITTALWAQLLRHNAVF
ncbi:hypothetical protein MRX96_033958 [Rhipicephalus microplus]